MDDALINYRNKLDSILTKEQKDTIAKVNVKRVIEAVKNNKKK